MKYGGNRCVSWLLFCEDLFEVYILMILRENSGISFEELFFFLVKRELFFIILCG